MKKLHIIKLNLSILFVAFSISCAHTNEKASISFNQSGDFENVIVKKGDAKLVYTTIKFPAGELEIAGGAQDLLNADFKYDDLDFKPEVNYSESSEIGNLNVILSKTNIDIDKEDLIKWDINLNNSVPMDLTIKMGAGEGNLNLKELNLQDLYVTVGAGEYYIDLRNSSVPMMQFKAGAGEATVDLSGERKNNLDADFTCGFGELKIFLPKNIGARVQITGLIGDIDYPGFKKKDNEYTNDLFRKTEINIDLEITAGMGEIELRLVD